MRRILKADPVIQLGLRPRCLRPGLLAVALSLLFLFCPALASADVQAVEEEGNISFVGFLCDGDQLHALCQEVVLKDAPEDAAEDVPFLQLGSYICYEITQEHELVPCTLHCTDVMGTEETLTPDAVLFQGVAATAVTPDQQTLALCYGMKGDYEVYRWAPDEEIPWVFVADFPDSGNFSLGGEPYLAADDTMLYASSMTDTTTAQWKLTAWDMVSGEVQVLGEITSSAALPAFGKDGSAYIAIEDVPISVLRLSDSLATSKTVTTFRSGQLRGFLSDEDGYLALDDSTLWRVDAEGNREVVNYIPRLSFEIVEGVALCKARNEVWYAYESPKTGEFMLASVSATPQEQQVLRIAGYSTYLYWLNHAVLLSFEASHPGVFVTLQEEPMAFADVASSLVLGNDQIDLFVLRTSDEGIRSVTQKGYCVDLSSREEIRAFVEQCYPIFQQEVTGKDGTIAAMPFLVAGNHKLTYLPEAWTAAGLEEVPQTWSELLSAIELYVTADFDENPHPLWDSGSSYRKLLDALLRANYARYALHGETPCYSNPDLLALLEQLEQMRPELDAFDRAMTQGSPLLDFSPSGPTITSEFYSYRPLSLTLGAEDSPTLPVELYALSVNPHSQQKELAMEFIASLLDTMSEEDRCDLLDIPSDGVEREGYATNVEVYANAIAEAKKNYEAAQANEYYVQAKDYKDLLQSLQEYYEMLIANRYRITPEDAAAYREGASSMVLIRGNSPTMLRNSISTAIDAYLDGKTNAETLTRRLDEVARMWEMENQ